MNMPWLVNPLARLSESSRDAPLPDPTAFIEFTTRTVMWQSASELANQRLAGFTN
jgi:hypothetical protein